MKVMVCTDGSELSKKAIETAVGVALPLNAELIGMTAVKGAEPKDGLAGEARDVQERLGVIYDAAKAAGLPCRVLAVHGEAPWQCITKLAKDEDVDYVVMASRGMGSIGSLFIGSETQKTLASIDRPVLVVR
ncbi:MAG TPA: universal stress protein [Candidatus Aphodousia faecipullorum]|nr:universal stress protein [Candidatus Aphodousia faecipullorum]